MSTDPKSRSVKIGEDERGGWSSDRPRRGAARRAPDLSVHCRVLTPEAQLRYSPGSLLVIVSASAAERDRFAARVLEGGGALLSLEKVRGVLAGRIGEDEAAARAPELLDAAVAKRLEANETVVLAAEGLAAESREPHVRTAARLRRPRHIILVEAPRDEVAEEDRAALNDLRRRLDVGELGAEGFQTALRVGGQAAAELKRIVFQPESRED